MIDEENQVAEMQDSTAEVETPEPAPQDAVEEAVTVEPTGEAAIPVGDASAVQDAPEVSGADEAVTSAAAIAYEKVAALESEIQTLRAQLEDRSGQYMRIAADFDNYRKRTQREKEEFEQQVKCSTINELLPVVDNFERARSHLKPQTEQETTIHKSYQSVYKQLVDCLKRIGVAPMRAEGKEFDPMLHEAVMRQPTADYEEGVVIEELQRGYMLGERVLRHALVKVAAPPEESDAAADAAEADNTDG